MVKKIPYVALAIIIVFLISFIFFLRSQPEKPVQAPSVETEQIPVPQEQTPEDVKKIMREAIDTRDASPCQRMEKETDKTACQINVIITEAGAKRDANICNQITEEYPRIACEDNIIINQAMDAKDPSLCQKLTDKARVEQCLEYVAP